MAGGTVGVPRGRVVLVRAGEKVEAVSEGDGMIDAACKAIRQATGIDGKLIDFNVSSVTGGVDALGDVIVQLDADGVRVSGRGVSTDVVEASARAYLNAVNKVIRIRGRNEVRARPRSAPSRAIDGSHAGPAGFVGVDVGGVAQRDPDVVEPLEQPVTGEVVHGERRLDARRRRARPCRARRRP